MNFWWKFGILIASYAFVGFCGWHAHTWYDGNQEAKKDAVIITERVAEEATVNKIANTTDKKIEDDEAKADTVIKAQEKDIVEKKLDYDCRVSLAGVQSLNKIATTRSSSR